MLLWLACGGSSARAATDILRLDQGVLSYPADPALPARTVSLPWDWRQGEAGNDGLALMELQFSFDGDFDEPYGLYFSRLGNRAEIRLNGRLLVRYGRLDGFLGADYAKAPRFVQVPADMLAHDNRLSILISADSGRHAGLSAVVFGPAGTVRNDYYASAYVWRIMVGSAVLMALCLLVGCVSLLLWQTQRVRGPGMRPGRRDVFYLYAGGASLCWALYLANNSIQFVPLQWPWWGLLVLAARNGALLGMLALGGQMANRMPGPSAVPGPRLRWLMAASLLAALVAWYVGRWEILLAWYLLESACLLYLSGWHLRRAFGRAGGARYRWLSLAILVGVLAAAHDWVVSWLGQGPSQAFALQYAALFQGLVLCCLVVARFNALTSQGQRMLEILSKRVAARERKLRRTYEKLELAAREQARTLERARIMRDMHDGVGLHIASAIRQLSGGDSDNAEVLRTLRDSLDQLKLSIDVMSLAPGDVTGMLSSLRFRLGPRLEAAGLALEWQVGELEPVAGMDAEGMRQLQYIVFAALANVLQHARATILRVEAVEHGDGLRVSIVDNGIGAGGRAPGQSMVARAAEFGWRVSVSDVAAPGTGTRVDIVVPR